MNFELIKPIDAANGIGIRVSLFVTGCRHNCFNCFSKHLQDFNRGKPYTEQEIQLILQYLDHHYINGLTILGGDPMEPENQEWVCKTIEAIRNKFNHTKTIWVYTGALYENVTHADSRYRTAYTDKILQNIDVLVDGPFLEAKKDIQHTPFRGSTNQRLIDVPETLKAGKCIDLKYP